MKIYHYTFFSKIGAILGKQRGEPAGLEPRRRIGGYFPNLEYPKAIFALLEPTPNNWVNNPHFPATWRMLVHHLRVMSDGALLIEADVEGKKDKAFVGERAHMEGLHYTENSIPREFSHQHLSEAERAFIESMTPLEEYIARQQAGEGFSLPEVVMLNPISSERISVSLQQPLIEDELASSHGEGREYLIQLITRGWAQHELQAWRATYEARFGSLEQQSRGKEAF